MIFEFYKLHFELLPFCLLFFTGLWLLSLPLKDASIVDRFWGLGFIFYFVVGFLYLGSPVNLKNLVGLSLISIWALRLSVHIHMRNKGHPEDYRYQEMRRKYKPFELLSLPIVFLLQGFLLWIVATPLLAILIQKENIYCMAAGFLIWAIGFYFEARGDWELKEFKKSTVHRGQLLTTGLWSLTRHPNYFGDTFMWCGIFVFSLPEGWFTFIGPCFMSLLIVKVSGVALTDKSLKQTKPGFEDYLRSTPAFFPKISGYKSFEK